LDRLLNQDSETPSAQAGIVSRFAAAEWVSQPLATKICPATGADTDLSSVGNDTVAVESVTASEDLPASPLDRTHHLDPTNPIDTFGE